MMVDPPSSREIGFSSSIIATFDSIISSSSTTTTSTTTNATTTTNVQREEEEERKSSSAFNSNHSTEFSSGHAFSSRDMVGKGPGGGVKSLSFGSGYDAE